MDMLVTYDVNTLTKEGRNRLRKVAKVCTSFGQRVQYSVFEVTVNAIQRERMMEKLLAVVNQTERSQLMNKTLAEEKLLRLQRSD